jgi:hypothetical protein
VLGGLVRLEDLLLVTVIVLVVLGGLGFDLLFRHGEWKLWFIYVKKLGNVDLGMAGNREVDYFHMHTFL